MKRPNFSLILITPLSAVLMMALLGGCTASGAKFVNESALARRTSSSDDLSRKLAVRTLEMIHQLEEDYRIGTDDVLSVSIFEWMMREETKTVEIRVSESGRVTLPLIGEITAKGKTVTEVEDALIARLVDGGFIKEPRVSVIVKEYRSKTIAVVGAVEDPGRFSIRQNVTTLLDALSLAGGRSERSGYLLYVLKPSDADGTDQARLDEEGTEQAVRTAFSGKVQKEVIVIDLIELLEEGNLDLNVVLENGDVVYVPEAPSFYIVGYVRKPGGFPLNRPMTVLEGIALAEGLMEREASPRDCALKRRNPDGEVIIPLDLVAIAQGESPNLYLQSNDIIDVRQTLLKKIGLEAFDTITRVFHVGYNLDERDL